MAIVGALRTKMLEMLVPSRIAEVAVAQAASTANWSPPWPSATHALSYPSASASTTHSTISPGASPPLNATPRRPSLTARSLQGRARPPTRRRAAPPARAAPSSRLRGHGVAGVVRGAFAPPGDPHRALVGVDGRGQRPAPVEHQPEAQQVPPAGGVRVVLEGRA